MTKITADHLARGAFVYIRQSTNYQVANNTESGRRKYGLVERARQLGRRDVVGRNAPTVNAFERLRGRRRET